MDFSAIFQAIWQFWYLIPVLIFITFIKTPFFKGIMGEWLVNIAAKIFLDKNTYHLLKNITLPTENGTTQIDHIIVSVYGVFVIETKNMKGRIYGKPNQATWTQKIFRHSSKFQNPLRQNYKHVKTLQSLLRLKDEQLHSVIVFVGDSTFKKDMPDNVTYARGYIRYIKSKTEVVLSQGEVNEITRKIESGRLKPSFNTNREHVQHVKNIVKEKQNNNSCPKCGADMVLRKAKKGSNAGQEFWGCSRFPQCRGL
ncbi:MAG: NERD domain-containing protein [gamma proteobacterium symbiont of Taylorina sp.]|nr:NERD domain-containing protein [gamma proteobacterium symbiont of Taylorina sp.]